MRKLLHILLAVILLGVSYADKQSYSGAKALGPFRIDRNTRLKSLFQRLGDPRDSANDPFCYRSSDGSASLVLSRMSDRTRAAGAVLLSSFRNCSDRPVQVTRAELKKWKTPEGIGLESTVKDIRAAYGKPSSERGIDETDYDWIIHGGLKDAPYASKKKQEIGETMLLYVGAADDLSVTKFGIRQGRVVWIFLSNDE